jgi:plastocyanin
VRARRNSAFLAAALTLALPAPVAAAALPAVHHGQKLVRSSQGRGPAATPEQGLEVVATPASPTAGQWVRLHVLGAPPGARFIWDLKGDGSHRRDTAEVPATTVRPLIPGPRGVAVRVVEAAQTRVASLELMVRQHRSGSRPAADQRSALGGRRLPAARGPITAHDGSVAADPAVTIADFNFSPANITIHAGETVTWTNNGPSAHTATARDGSFDTGVLQKGQSASHTFTHAGTFTYFCRIHPFMQGTITVVTGGTAAPSPPSTPSTSTTGASGTSTPPPSNAPAPASAASSQALPTTGYDIVAVLATGVVLVAGGGLVRRFLRQ